MAVPIVLNEGHAFGHDREEQRNVRQWRVGVGSRPVV